MLNIVPFGVDSFNQGDTFGGTTLAVIDGLSALSVLLAFNSYYAGNLNVLLWFTLSGALGLIAGRIVGFIAPHQYYSEVLSLYYDQQIKSQNSALPSNEPRLSLLNYQLNF